MFVLAHLSDLHHGAERRGSSSLPASAGWASSTGSAAANTSTALRRSTPSSRDLKAVGADHIAVTGDLVNLSLPVEYAAARAWLEKLGPPHDVTVIPGNHDAYVPKALGGPAEYWGDYMRGDDGAEAGTFPFVRRRGAVALIALSSALPTGPFMATGELGDGQLSGLAQALEQTSGMFRIVLMHHPPGARPTGICGA